MTIRDTGKKAPTIVVREDDTTAITVQTGLGDISSGTATAQILAEDANTLTETIACSGLNATGEATVDLTALLDNGFTVPTRYLMTVTSVVGGETNTSPSWDQEPFVILVEPKYE